MKTLSAVALLSGIAAAPLAIPAFVDLAERVTALEKRVTALERLVEPQAWSVERMYWLQCAAINLLQTKASIAALAKNGVVDKAGEAAINALKNAEAQLGVAQAVFGMGDTDRGSRTASMCLEMYNSAAKHVGVEERRIDSPRVDLLHLLPGR